MPIVAMLVAARSLSLVATAFAAAQDSGVAPVPAPSRGVIEPAMLTTMPRGGEDVRASIFVGTWSLTD